MTKEQYERWSSPFRKWKYGTKLLIMADKTITAFIFFAYPLLLAYLMIAGRFWDLFFYVAIPAVSFLAVSFFRARYSAKRPYEALEICPLLKKETKGKSFPSRHVFSIFIIGMTFLYENTPIGIAIGVLGVLLSYIRVALGVHFPKDVAAGAALGILCGLLYWI